MWQGRWALVVTGLLLVGGAAGCRSTGPSPRPAPLPTEQQRWYDEMQRDLDITPPRAAARHAVCIPPLTPL